MVHNGFLAIGKIVGVHGVRGNLKVLSYAESLDHYASGKSLFIRHPKSDGKNHLINWVKPHKKAVLLSVNGVNDRDQAQALIGAELFIAKANLPQTEEDTWYWFDLIGVEVITLDDRYLGKIKNVFRTGSNDVFEVHDPEKKSKPEILIPALKTIIIAVDLEKKVMRVDLPEGLL